MKTDESAPGLDGFETFIAMLAFIALMFYTVHLEKRIDKLEKAQAHHIP